MLQLVSSALALLVFLSGPAMKGNVEIWRFPLAAKSAINAGARLPAREAANFIGQAQRTVIREGEVLYGIRDAGSRNLWWTRTCRTGELQWRMDQAVLRGWNEGTYIETLTVPKGQSIIGFEGPARGQG